MTGVQTCALPIYVIFTQNLSFLIEHDFKILSENKNWTYDVLDVSKSNTQNKFIRLINSFLQKLAYFTLSYYPTLIAYKLSLNKNYYWQKKKAIKTGANLFIAHNLGALAVAFEAAKKNSAKCGFDAEDFHRAELHQNLFQKETKTVIKIENYY